MKTKTEENVPSSEQPNNIMLNNTFAVKNVGIIKTYSSVVKSDMTPSQKFNGNLIKTLNFKKQKLSNKSINNYTR